MASSSQLLLTLSLLLLISSTAFAASSFRPKALVLPVNKDTTTNQYVVKLNQRTPIVSVPVTLDLGAQFLWVNCEQGYTSSSYRPARCHSAQCSLANSKSCGTCNSPPRPGCNNNTCGLFPENPFTNTATGGELASDVVKILSTDGTNPGRLVTVPNFLFVCGPKFLLKGLAKGAQGIAGLGRTKISLPSQFSTSFNLPRKFAICLSPTLETGVVFFGDGPYNLISDPYKDVSKGLIYTPLITNPGQTSTEYFIRVDSIKINSKQVPIHSKSLTKISTVTPYTVLETSIYKAFTELFINEVKSFNASRVGPVGPFKVCYDVGTFPFSRAGPGAPAINLVLQNEKVVYTIWGANSMVQFNNINAICLAFVDGGANPKGAIVIGGYQLENFLLQFDLARSRLGFSEWLPFSQTRCGSFNFTSSV